MRYSAVFLLPFCAILACGSQTPPAAQDAQIKSQSGKNDTTNKPVAVDENVPAQAEMLRSAFAGTVAGYPSKPLHNFFIRGKMNAPGNPSALIFVQTDNEQMCQHLTDGTMPKEATMFAVALVDTGKDKPAVNKTYIAGGDQDENPQPMLYGYFRKLDAYCECEPGLPEDGAQAQHGSAQLRALNDNEASVSFNLRMANEDGELDSVFGVISGPLCPGTALLQNPMPLTTGVIEAGACR